MYSRRDTFRWLWAAVVISLIQLSMLPAGVQAQGTVDIGGYGSFRLEGSDIEGGAPAFTLRRFVVTTDARVGGDFQVYSEVEYERLTEIEVERGVEAEEEGGIEFEQELEGTNASEIALEQAWAQYDMIEPLSVRFGAVLPPVGRFNRRHDDNLWNVTERPLINRAAQVLPGQAAWTEMGLGFVGYRNVSSDVQIGYEGYLLTGTTLDFAIEHVAATSPEERSELKMEAVVSPTQGAFDGSNPADAAAARLLVSPGAGSEYAVSGYLGQYTPEFLPTSERLSTLGFDMRQEVGDFFVEGEFLHTWYSNVDGVLRSFAETAIDHASETEADETADLKTELEIELDGLADRRYGFWVDAGRTIPLEPGTFGLNNATLTPTVRYERAWLAGNVGEFDFAGGEIEEIARGSVQQDRLWVGIAFRPVPPAVFQLFYKRSNALRGAFITPAVEADESGKAVNAVSFGVAFGF